MKLVGYVYNKDRASAKPSKSYYVTPNEDGTYTLGRLSYPFKEYILQGLNSPIRCERRSTSWVVVIDEDDPNNFIWLNDMHGNNQKGFILERYSHGYHKIIVAIFNDKVIKLNARLEGIPFIRTDIKSNKVLFFSTYGVAAYDNVVAEDNLVVLDKKIKDAEEFLEDLKAAREMINNTLSIGE